MDDEERAGAEGRRGELVTSAEALVARADALIKQSRLEEAQRDLDEAALRFRKAGQPEDEARCNHLAATLLRLLGRLAEADDRARRAALLAAQGTPTCVAAWTELGEIGMAQQDGLGAAFAYDEALRQGNALLPGPRGALLRRYAQALSLAGEIKEAAKKLALAARAFDKGGDRASARRARIEEAGARLKAGQTKKARRLYVQARTLAEAAKDAQALAEAELFAAALALEARDCGAAYLAARRAREHALEAVDPLSYVAAAVALAELAELLGERVAAYEALAVGWVTLGDLLGAEVARNTFGPKLQELRERWGATEFDKVKTTYEARRRNMMAPTPGS